MAAVLSDRDVRVSDDPAAEDHIGSETSVSITVITKDINAQRCDNFAVLMHRNVIADLQRYISGFGEYLAFRHITRRIQIVSARSACVAFGKTSAALHDQIQ